LTAIDSECGLVRVGDPVPGRQEGVDLVRVEVLQGIGGELCPVQDGALVADRARGDQDPRLGIAGGEPGDLTGDRLAHLGVEDLVQTVEDHPCPPVITEVGVENLLRQAWALVGAMQEIQVAQEGLPPALGVGVGTQLDEHRKQRPEPAQQVGGWRRPRRGVLAARQRQGQVASQSRLA
jgi:hypothetical protein